MAVDPGVTTGVFAAVVPPRGEMPKRVERAKLVIVEQLNWDSVKGVPGADSLPVAVAYKLCLMWVIFAEKCLEAGIEPSLVCEDYNQSSRGGVAGGRGADEFMNVRILEAFAAMLWYGMFEAEDGFIRDMKSLRNENDSEGTYAPGELMLKIVDSGMGWIYQVKKVQPAGMATITDERLKRWGLWDLAIGKQHTRDAQRHWVVEIRNLTRLQGT